MGISSKEPWKIRGIEAADWRYLEVQCKETVCAFLAGQPTGVYCHTLSKKSKPCRAVTSDGKLPCKLCGREKPTWRGFTPVYDSEYCWRFVVITASYRESVSEIERFQQVKISRGRKITDACVIRAANWRTQAIPENEERKPEPYLIDRLLILWGDAELAAWHYSDSDIPVSQEPSPLRRPKTTEPANPEIGAIADILEGRMTWPGKGTPDAPGPKLVGDVLDVLPMPNGKPKKK